MFCHIIYRHKFLKNEIKFNIVCILNIYHFTLLLPKYSTIFKVLFAAYSCKTAANV